MKGFIDKGYTFLDIRCAAAVAPRRARTPCAVRVQSGGSSSPAQRASDVAAACACLSTTDEYRSGNKLFFVHLPVAELRPDGSPAMNPYFVAAFTEKFVNKLSRVMLCCQDGEMRSELAAKLVTDAGFSSIAVIAGGMDAYLAALPLTEKDKKARIAAVVQPDAGVKYGYGSDRNSDTA